MDPLPIQVHVGSEALPRWDEIEQLQRDHGKELAPIMRDARRPLIASSDLDWARYGLAPRWIGDDTTDCAVALQPAVFAGHGADEYERFETGAASRGEVALAVSQIGGQQLRPRSVLDEFDGGVSLRGTFTSIAGRTLGRGASVQVADGLTAAERDLALRLRNVTPPLEWSRLSVIGAALHSGDGSGVTHHYPEGDIVPILQTALGEPVVGVWVSPDGAKRHYIVPAGTPWELLLAWLTDQALPAYVPGAMRRARSSMVLHPKLLTMQERNAQDALEALEADYLAKKGNLEGQLAQARAAAGEIRDGLLYGTGKDLVAAVKAVLERAGIDVVDLDETLGGTVNADLLCSFAGRARLVEVKSAAGRPSERLYDHLIGHLREWPSLPESTPVEGGALVVNHEHRTPPLARNPRAYTRSEFLTARTEPVLTTMELLSLWREENWGGLVAGIFPVDGSA